MNSDNSRSESFHSNLGLAQSLSKNPNDAKWFPEYNRHTNCNSYNPKHLTVLFYVVNLRKILMIFPKLKEKDTVISELHSNVDF